MRLKLPNSCLFVCAIWDWRHRIEQKRFTIGLKTTNTGSISEIVNYWYYIYYPGIDRTQYSGSTKDHFIWNSASLRYDWRITLLCGPTFEAKQAVFAENDSNQAKSGRFDCNSNEILLEWGGGLNGYKGEGRISYLKQFKPKQATKLQQDLEIFMAQRDFMWLTEKNALYR